MTATRSPAPWGATEAFAAEVEAKLGKPFALSWLGEKTCRFTDTTIFTTALGRDWLEVHCYDLMQKHAVTVAVCPDVTAALYRSVDASGKGRA